MLDLVPVLLLGRVDLQVQLQLVLAPLHLPRLDVDQIQLLVLEHPECPGQTHHALDVGKVKVYSRQFTVDSLQYTVYSRQFTVDSLQ